MYILYDVKTQSLGYEPSMTVSKRGTGLRSVGDDM